MNSSIDTFYFSPNFCNTYPISQVLHYPPIFTTSIFLTRYPSALLYHFSPKSSSVWSPRSHLVVSCYKQLKILGPQFPCTQEMGTQDSMWVIQISVFNNSKILSHWSYYPFHLPRLFPPLVHLRVTCTTALLPSSNQLFILTQLFPCTQTHKRC